MLKTIPVRLKNNPYPIYIGSGAISQLGNLLSRHKLTGTAFVVSQEPVWKACGPALKSALQVSGFAHESFVVPARTDSEKLKSLPYFLKILSALVHTDRKSGGVFVVALGGGVVGDAAGFVSAVYKRGIPVVQIPTTLTAQVDSAIGGKTAIDLPQGKNLLGAFHQPQFVLADTKILSSLPPAIFKDGLAEVVKYGVIQDAKFLAWIEKNHAAILRREDTVIEKIVTVCARIKARVVAGDERDTRGIRMTLNFGHTLGHALETAAGYASLSHGQAVSIGMCAAVDLSAQTRVLKDGELPGRLRRILVSLGLPVAIPARLQRNKILEAIFYDKKRKNGKNRFVLVASPGKTIIDPDVSIDEVDRAVRLIHEKKESIKRNSQDGFLGKWFIRTSKRPKPRGVVENYLDRLGVAIIRWEKGTLKKGEWIKIEGPKTALSLQAGSLQIDRVEVAQVKRGDAFGMKVSSAVRAGDQVY